METELKLSFPDPGLVLNQFRQGVATHPVEIVHDIYFDIPNTDFRLTDQVLRFRTQGNRFFLAYKGPRLDTDRLIQREQYETEVVDRIETLKIISALGFVPREVVEKERRLISFDNFPDLTVVLDRLPFLGHFIEIEGTAVEIERFVRAARLKDFPPLRRNYTELFEDYCNQQGLAELLMHRAHLTFDIEREWYETHPNGNNV